MSKLQPLLEEYGESHQNRTNVIIHKFCVPLIMLSVIGLFYAIPAPQSLAKAGFDWAILIVAATLGYYFYLSKKYFFYMIPFIGGMYALVKLAEDKVSILWASVAIFIVSWIFQFIGHKIEGKKPSFLKDALFLLVGPLWVAKSLFRIR